MIFLLIGRDFLNISTSATDEMVEEINDKKALDIARSATNVVISYFWQQPDSVKLIGTSKVFYDNVAFNGGIVSSRLVRDSINANLFRIKTNASYGDSTSLREKTIVVLYGPQRLTEMASFSEWGGNIWWTGSDIVNGAVYCKSDIQVYDHPTFNDKVYSGQHSFDYFSDKNNDYPNLDSTNLFFGADLKRAGDALNEIQTEAQSGGWYLWGNNSGWSAPAADTMYIEIKGTNMEVKFSKSDPPASYNIATKVPNKVIFADNYVVRLKGELDGQLLISCSGDSDYGKGKILLDDDIIYKDDPRNGASDDLLGLVAEGFIEVADTQPNQTDINVHAAIYSSWEGLTAENATTKADAGKINFLGSLIEHERKAVGSFTAAGVLTGYGRNYDYDTRLKNISPPFFPSLQGFNVLAWYEGESAKNQ